jgi:hypothetical protein
MEVKAIITGDIISSRDIEATKRQKLYLDLDAFLQSMIKKWIATYETYRGDSFQCEVKETEQSLRVALMIKAYIVSYASEGKTAPRERLSLAGKSAPSAQKGYFNKEFDIRLAIGMGQVDFLNKKKITTSDGEAFRLSGEALDEMKDGNETLTINTNNEGLNTDLIPMIILVDALTQKWTQNQAELVLFKLMGKKDEDMAKEWGVTVSAVTQRKKTAQWSAIEVGVQYFENKLAKFR